MSQTFIERRKARRRNILERFSFYVCVPKLGYTRHKVNDISELGIGFEVETLGEFKLAEGEICELQFYVNQSLFLRLHIEVVRQKEIETIQHIGASFLDVQSNPQVTFNTLVKLVDQLSDFAEVLE